MVNRMLGMFGWSTCGNAMWLPLVAVVLAVAGCQSPVKSPEDTHAAAQPPFVAVFSSKDEALLDETRATLRNLYAPDEWARRWSGSETWSSTLGVAADNVPLVDVLASAWQLGAEVVVHGDIGAETPVTIEHQPTFNYADRLNAACEALNAQGHFGVGVTWHVSGTRIFLNADGETLDSLIVGEYTLAELPDRRDRVALEDWRWRIESVAAELRRVMAGDGLHGEQVDVVSSDTLRVTATAHRHLVIKDWMNGTPAKHMYRE